ncbi:hypothetical protein D6C78_04117 [Aureobasidium pullulans]|uniref:Uncharacterized protein n=1 Tax=Aureobasidium pullulans TaxID=5580 RepID=A0A4T0C0Q8_AURPU|nr:hypothetical protein D6C78_04117 [Aureobasidium pullulans]
MVLDFHHDITSHSVKMPISKKDRIHREHKKAEAAGTRIPVNPNGTPKKVPKATSICVFCKKELTSSNLAILEQHAGTHPDAWTKEKCWPNEFK